MDAEVEKTCSTCTHQYLASHAIPCNTCRRVDGVWPNWAPSRDTVEHQKRQHEQQKQFFNGTEVKLNPPKPHPVLDYLEPFPMEEGVAFYTNEKGCRVPIQQPLSGASSVVSDGGSTAYYQVPPGASELNDLIEHKKMSFALGNIFKACYRLGEKSGTDAAYDVRKIIFFANRILNQLEKTVA